MTYTDFMSQTLAEASALAKKYFGNVTSSIKPEDSNQVLTEADIAIGSQIVTAIEKQFPGHNIIDEEAGVIDKKSSFTWVVDPIDGTSNFATGLPTYGVMIGLLENDIPIAGGLALPAFDEIYLGGKGTPTTKNGKLVQVSQETDLKNSLLAYGIDGHPEAPEKTEAETTLLKKIILGIRNLRTTNSAYDMAKTIEGKYGLSLNQTTKIWDNVALHALVEAASGICTAFWGKPINYKDALIRSQENFTICAGSPLLHKQIQAIITSWKNLLLLSLLRAPAHECFRLILAHTKAFWKLLVNLF